MQLRTLRVLFFLTIFLGSFYGISYSQLLGAGVLTSSRVIDWTHAGVPGGIPARTTICQSLNPGATAAQINAAIAACPTGQVVFLNAGTYNLSSGITFQGANNVTLRGAGADQTMLVFTGAANCEIFQASICLTGSSSAWTGNPGTVVNWTGTTEGGPGVYPQGATHLTLSSAAGLSVNSYLVVDQLNDAGDTGNVFVNMSSVQEAGDTAPFFSQEGGAPGRNCSQNSTCHAQQQFFEVTGISGNTVTVTPGLYMPNWRTGNSPQAWSPGVIGKDVSTLIGVENLSVDSTNDGGAASSNIEFGNCYVCWAKGVRSIDAHRNHVWLYQASHVEIRDSYFYGTKNAQSQSYGVESFMTADDLIINNIFQKVVAPLMIGNNHGSAYGYNFSVNDYETVSSGWLYPAIDLHDASVGFVLFEGNETADILVDDIHGSEAINTLFRNFWIGWEIDGATGTRKNGNTVPIKDMANGRFTNAIGNVLGEPGYHTNYLCDQGSSGCNEDVSIYSTGWSGNGSTCCSMLNDSLVLTTLMRWGNYDVVNNAARFVGSEVPSNLTGSLSAWANPVPSSQTLPASFFLQGKPGWWGSNAFPPFGPDVAGGNVGIVNGGGMAGEPCTAAMTSTQLGGGTCGGIGASWGGHVNAIPAFQCYISMGGLANGISNVLNFNANACYGSVISRPAAPTNLTNRTR